MSDLDGRSAQVQNDLIRMSEATWYENRGLTPPPEYRPVPKRVHPPHMYRPMVDPEWARDMADWAEWDLAKGENDNGSK